MVMGSPAAVNVYLPTEVDLVSVAADATEGTLTIDDMRLHVALSDDPMAHLTAIRNLLRRSLIETELELARERDRRRAEMRRAMAVTVVGKREYCRDCFEFGPEDDCPCCGTPSPAAVAS